MKKPRKNGHRKPDARLTRRIEEQETLQSVARSPFEYERLPHELQARQIALETQNRELTEALREERDFLGTVLDAANALTLVLDSAGRIVRFNRTCELLSGYSFAEATGRAPWDFLVPPEEVASVKRQIARLRQADSSLRSENHWVTKDGARRLISWMNALVRNPDGTIKHIICSGIDVTRWRELETDVLEISDREQQRIGQDLHDSLGQQLTAVRLMCHSLQEDPAFSDPALKHKAKRIAGLLQEAIRQTRALSHGLAPLQPGAGGLMDALRELARITSESGSVKCRFQCVKPVPIANSAVAGHLYRIAQEAVNNASTHGHAGEISLELTRTKSTVGLRISDNGKGFDGARKPIRGMGLQVMNRRAEIMGGKLTFQSRKGKGVTVKCTVPVRKP